MPVRTQNVSQHVLSKHLPCQRGHKMLLKQVLTKHLPSQREHKMYRNMCLLNPSHDRGDSICNTTCVDQNPSQASEFRTCSSSYVVESSPMPAMTPNVPLLVMNKCIPCFKNTKCISTFVVKTPVIRAIAYYVPCLAPTSMRKHNPCL